MKYRVKEEIKADGSVTFFAQYKFKWLGKWHNLSPGRMPPTSLKEAMDRIDEVKKRNAEYEECKRLDKIAKTIIHPA